MKTLILRLVFIFSIHFLNWSKTESLNQAKIVVEYDENSKCKNCPKWILIEGNYKKLDRKKAKRMYIQSINNLTTNELDHLFEKQVPLVLELYGDFSKTKINGYEVFLYSKYQIVEY